VCLIVMIADDVYMFDSHDSGWCICLIDMITLY
jgi:hypothetical protein